MPNISLPNPDTTLDVWGNQVNAAISSINDAVDLVEGEVDVIQAALPNAGSGIPLAQKGAPNGVATLDSGGQLPIGQLGNVSPTNIGAAAAVHQHSLGDLPDMARTLRATPVFTVYNTTTNAWPASRASLTTDVLRPVIWFGGTALPADAIVGVDAWIKTDTTQLVVAAAGGGATTPPPTSGTIVMSTPTVTVNGSNYNMTADFTNGSTSKTFAYIQLVVRGPGGSPSADTGYVQGRTLAPGEKITLTGTGSATVTGAWTVKLAYTETGASWVEGTAATFNITSLGGGASPGDPGSTRTIPLIGRSGLAWNSGVFRDAGSLTAANEFATFRGRPVDSIMYFTGRTNQSDMNWLRSDLNSWPGYRIISMPTQVESRGNFGTNASDIAFWQNWGTLAKNQGWNDGRTIVRLNWECNGNWYPWAWQNGGAALFVQTWKSAVNAIRSTAPKMLFNICVNRGNVNGGVDWKTQILDPLIAHYDIIGLDWYDEWPNWKTQSSFNSSLAVSPGPGPTNLATYARANSKMLWLDEWGMSWRPEAGTDAGKDDPAGIGFMYNWLVANADVVAGESYFEDYGTNDQFHYLMTGKNPLAAAEYVKSSRFGGK